MSSATNQIDLESDILVKDTDGKFKVFDHGQLKDLTAGVSQKPLNGLNSGAGVFLLPSASKPAVVPADEHFLHLPKAQLSKGARSAFHFHPDDEAEIEVELNKINDLLAGQQQRKYSVEKIARKLVEKHGISLAPAQFVKFVKILLSFFRQARNFVQTKELLKASEDLGGLGLKIQDVDDIGIVIRNLKDKIEGVDGVVVEAAQEGGSETDLDATAVNRNAVKPDTLDPFRSAKLEKERLVKVQPEVKKIEPSAEAIKTPAPVQILKSVPPEVIKPLAPVEPAIKADKQKSETGGGPYDLPKVKRFNSLLNTKPTDTVVPRSKYKSGFKVSAKLMGKVDELANMTLEEFRLLDSDPRVRVAKILQRIENLQADSVTRKAQGIEAWRSSQVYQIYLSLGQRSLEQAKEISVIVADMQGSGQPILSVEEFEAISDLNKKLRF